MTFPRFLRRSGTAALVLIALSLPAAAANPPAPTPEHLALARAVIDFTGGSKAFDKVRPKLLNDARTVILRTHPDYEADLDPIIVKLDKEMADREQVLLNNVAKIYASKFSESELKEIAAFYQSPAGQKLTQTMPEVLRESYQLAQEWAQKFSTDVMTRIREEMKKKGHDL